METEIGLGDDERTYIMYVKDLPKSQCIFLPSTKENIESLMTHPNLEKNSKGEMRIWTRSQILQMFNVIKTSKMAIPVKYQHNLNSIVKQWI